MPWSPYGTFLTNDQKLQIRYYANPYSQFLKTKEISENLCRLNSLNGKHDITGGISDLDSL